MRQQETLTIRHPDAREALLLRALLSAGDYGREAWARWIAPIEDSAWLEHLSPYKRIWPLFLRALVRNETPIRADVRIALKAAFAAEKIRHIRVWRQLESCVVRLSAAGVASAVHAGGALAVTVYPEPGLRHVHAVRLGVSDVERALMELPKERFVPRDDTLPTAGEVITLEGPNGQQLEVAFDEDASEMPPRGAPPALQPPDAALSSAFGETLVARANPLVWAFDVFFVTRLRRRAGSTKSARLVNEAIEILGNAIEGRG